MADVKQILKETIEKHRKAKADEDSVRQQKNDSDRNKILENISSDLASALAPVLAELPKAAQISEETIKNALTEAIQVNMPEMDMGGMSQSIGESIREAFANIKIPAPQVKVSVPEIKIPEVRIPETKYPDRMNVGLEDYNAKNPLVVRLVDTNGKPFSFSVPISSGGGGKSDFFTIKGFSQSAYSELMNADGRLKVSVETGGSGLTDNELRATSVPVSQVSGATFSTNVVDAFGSTAVGSVFNADNRIRVSVETGGSGLTDVELRASHLDVQQVSGSTDSVNVVSTVGLTDTELRATSVPVEQVSGSTWSTNVLTMPAVVVTSVTNSVAVVNLNPDGTPIDLKTITGITNTVATANVDSSGVQYSGSNPMPTYLVAGSGNSTISVGDLASGTADTGSAPVKVGGIARTANPTAEANGDRITFTADDLGRQVIRMHQVRDLVQTAYVSVANGTETTLRAGVAGAYLDLVMIVASNNSDAAVSVDIRPVTGGNIVNTLRIPANGTAGWTPAVAWPQTDTGNNWTVDGPDETGRTLTFSALFSQEV